MNGGVQSKGIAVVEAGMDTSSFSGVLTAQATELQSGQSCKSSYSMTGSKK